MLSTVVTSTLILSAVSQASVALTARQSTVQLNAVQGTTILGSIYVDASGALAVSTSDATSLFYISDNRLYAALGGSSDPHAFISFDNFGTSCGIQGPLVFTGSDTNKCSQQVTFSFDDDVLVFSTAGSFEVCGTGSYIAYNTDPSSPSAGCVNVDIIQA